jgi:hypothetical protein
MPAVTRDAMTPDVMDLLFFPCCRRARHPGLVCRSKLKEPAPRKDTQADCTNATCRTLVIHVNTGAPTSNEDVTVRTITQLLLQLTEESQAPRGTHDYSADAALKEGDVAGPGRIVL